MGIVFSACPPLAVSQPPLPALLGAFPDGRIAQDAAAVLADSTGGPVVILADRAAGALARAIVEDRPPHAALRDWTLRTAALLADCRGRRRQVTLVDRATAAAFPGAATAALKARLGRDAGAQDGLAQDGLAQDGLAQDGLAQDGPGPPAAAAEPAAPPPDPVLAHFALLQLPAQSEAAALDAELAALLLPVGEDAGASRVSQDAPGGGTVALAALRHYAALLRRVDNLSATCALLETTQRVLADQHRQLVRDRAGLAAKLASVARAAAPRSAVLPPAGSDPAARAAALEAECAELRRQIDALYRSRSWQFSAPVRMAGRLLRRLHG